MIGCCGPMSRVSWPAAIILAFALAFRLWLALGLPNDEPDDGRLYALLAHNIVAHGVYSADDGPPHTPTFIRVPGYPLLLAGVYELFGDGNNTAVRIVQAVLDTITCGLIAALAVLWMPTAAADSRRRVGLVALTIAAGCPFVAIYVATILTETLATLLCTLAIVFGSWALRADYRHVGRPSMRWLLAGLAAGVATLVRPESGLVVAALGTMLVLANLRHASPRRRCDEPRPHLREIARHVGGSGLLLTLGFALPLAPWATRNALVLGRFEPLNPRSVAMPGEFVAAGYAAWVRTWIHDPRPVWPLLFALDERRIRIEDVPEDAFDTPEERARVTALLDQYNAPRPDADPGDQEPGGMTPEVDARFQALARERIDRHPLRYYVKLPVERALTLWLDPHADYYPFSGDLFPLDQLDRDRDQQWWLPLFVALTLAWTAAGWWGAWRLWRLPHSRRWLVLVALLVIPRLALLAWLENPEPRYTMEFFPLVSALGAIAMALARSPSASTARRDGRSPG
jgi:hypothetical protein